MTRKRFSKRALDKLLASFGGKCRMCQCAIDGTSGLEWDHRVPLAINGKDDLDNLEPLCVRCHRIKTASDKGLIAKANRQRQRNLGVKDPNRRKIPSRKAEPRPSKPLPPRRPMFVPKEGQS